MSAYSAIFVILSGFIIVGLLTGESVGYAVFGILCVALLWAGLLIRGFIKADFDAVRRAKISWMILNGLILCLVAIYFIAGRVTFQGFILDIVILSAPLSILAVYFLVIIGNPIESLFNRMDQSGEPQGVGLLVMFVLVWMPFMVLGYVQWFYLVPKIVNKLRSWKHHN